MEIKENWKNDPLYIAGKVELVPTDWVYQYYGRDVTPEADLLDGTIVSMDELWNNIVSEGLHHPVMMRVGVKNKKFRLEAGNHRIQMFHKHNIPMIPVTVHVTEECGPHVDDVMTDATHNFDFSNEIIISEITDKFMKPSEVFKSLSKL